MRGRHILPLSEPCGVGLPLSCSCYSQASWRRDEVPWKTDQYLEKSAFGPAPAAIWPFTSLGRARLPSQTTGWRLTSPAVTRPSPASRVGTQRLPEPQSPSLGPGGQLLGLHPCPKPAAFGQMDVRGLRELGVGGREAGGWYITAESGSQLGRWVSQGRRECNPHTGRRVSGWLGRFPGSPVLKTPLRFHCRGRGFHPWLGTWDSHMPRSVA